MAVSYGGGQGGTDHADDFVKHSVKKPVVVKKKKLKKKTDAPSITLEVKAAPIEKVEYAQPIRWEPIIKDNPEDVKIEWKSLFKTKRLEKLQEALDSLGKVQPRHIDKIIKRFKKKVKVEETEVEVTRTKVLPTPKPAIKKIEVQLPITNAVIEVKPMKLKPKVALDFTDDELLLAIHLLGKKLKPKVNLDFTDEEILLAIYVMMEKKK